LNHHVVAKKQHTYLQGLDMGKCRPGASRKVPPPYHHHNQVVVKTICYSFFSPKVPPSRKVPPRATAPPLSGPCLPAMIEQNYFSIFSNYISFLCPSPKFHRFSCKTTFSKRIQCRSLVAICGVKACFCCMSIFQRDSKHFLCPHMGVTSA